MNQTKRGMTPLWVAPFLQALREGLGTRAASEAAGIGSSTVYRRRIYDDGFRAAWDAIRSVAPRATPTGRNSPRDRRRIDRFLANLAETSNVAAAAVAADLAVSNVYRLRRTDPDFAKRWYAALAEGCDNLEMAMLQYLRSGEAPGDGAGRKFDVAGALRSLTAHRETVAREKGRRTLADEVATIAAINAKIDAMRARAKEGEAAIRRARKSAKKRSGNDGEG